MFSFQCVYNSFDVQLNSRKVVTFRNYVFQTNDENVAAELRSKSGRDFWEMPTEAEVEAKKDEIAKIESAAVEPPKRRGRPPKVKVMQGMRTSEVLETPNEGEKQ